MTKKHLFYRFLTIKSFTLIKKNLLECFLQFVLAKMKSRVASNDNSYWRNNNTHCTVLSCIFCFDSPHCNQDDPSCRKRLKHHALHSETQPPEKQGKPWRQIASTHENGQRKKLARLILIAINYILPESCNLDAATTLLGVF